MKTGTALSLYLKRGGGGGDFMIVSAAIQLSHNRTPVNSHFLRAAFISPNTQMKCWKLDGTVRSSCRETKALELRFRKIWERWL